MTRRVDAALNDERIVDAALHELAADPNAGMDRLAAAAGVGRATLYRRFPTREDLLSRLREQAKREALAVMTAARVDEGSAAEALERLLAALLPIADRYAYLAQPTRVPHVPDPALAKPWLRLITRGQASGELSSEVPAEWWLAAIRAHFQQAALAVSAGCPLHEAAALAARAVLGGLRA